MTKQVVLVTGCSQGGIGYALAKKFAQNGNHVVATARKITAMDGLEALGCDLQVLDVNSQESIDKLVKNIIDRVGHIDILINNAGVPAVGALMDIDLDTVEACFNTNVFSILRVSRAVAKHMAQAGSGKIVNIGSVVGYVSTPWAGIYAASKAAVHSISDTLRMELKPFGIQVTVVAPGAITSNFGHAGESTVKVPEDSLYTSVAKYIVSRATLSQGPNSTPTDVFAAHVVKRVSQSVAPRYVTFGSTSWVFFLLYFLPHFVRDYIFYKRFSVNLVTLSSTNKKQD